MKCFPCQDMDLRRYYGLDFVMSFLEKKAEAAILKAKLDQDSTSVPSATSAASLLFNSEKSKYPEQKRPIRLSVAYDIAASAASYVHSRAKDLLSLGSEPQQEGDGVVSRDKGDHSQEEEGNSASRVYKSEMAAYMAASTMTSVVAAGEKEKQEAARDLQSLHSSPCEWFVCDDLSTCTHCFVIQGSDSVASWHANLFFEPTKFEETEVIVHRGIYEAAKGIYEQFMPGIMEHLNKYGDRAKFQFTGHSLGGSLSLLVNLMLLARKVVKPSALLPVVTFGSPFVFCGGQKILDELGLDESHVHCVMMHRDIVPRAFSCNYPNHITQLLKQLKSFRSHPSLNKNKSLYSPMGKVFILQSDENSSPPHPLLPSGCALYALEQNQCGSTKSALKAFLNSPHPLETLKDPTAYGSEGTILRDHDSSNYLKAMNGVIRQHRKMVVRKVRKQNLLWPLLTAQSPHAWSQEQNLENNRMVTKEVMTSA
ncbi:phospholipase A1 PLIP1, chloroplastic-like isoform X1 [Cornus florida]|uniref:phospholipase A1 PLIP1, chloroplastic-like isoform X1 n=2 Tax=Cornus florida TaxID=4283 RepID=UPI002897E35E|nr:phospholipase A1 PLIP1, chloroplastic-like isoform X1 [Cornus florida]